MAKIKLALKKGAEIDSRDKIGRTPLSYAVRHGHEAVEKLLLEKGAKLET
jgi:ankyrin repeat protein